MRPDCLVEQLCQLMGEDEENYGIEWRGNPAEGFEAVVNGTGLFMFQISNVTRGPFVTLRLTYPKTEPHEIMQPEMHASQSPMGKFFRWLTGFLGRGPYPRPPTSPEDLERERLRVALRNLYVCASKQHLNNMAKSPDEGARQELFRNTTFGKQDKGSPDE